MASPESALVSNMTDEEFERRTLEAIQREFGLGGLARFIMTYRSGRGDYTRDRHQWLDSVSIEEIQRELNAQSPG